MPAEIPETLQAALARRAAKTAAMLLAKDA